MKQYQGLFFLLATIIFVSLVSVLFLHWGGRMTQLMGRWFLLFGLIKLRNIRAFASLFHNYDFFAMHWSVYGLLYPFLEIVLGIAYLLHAFLSGYDILLYSITIVVTTSTAWGIIRFMRSGKTPLQCACLGSSFSLPLGWISLGEQLLMLSMALFMFYSSSFPMKNSIIIVLFALLATAVFTGCSKQNTTLSTTTDTGVLVDTTREIVAVGHDGLQFVPSTIKLAKGKNYSIEVTPNSDGRGCMTEVVIPGKGPHAIKQGQTFTIEVDGTEAKTIPLVCASMGMKQGEIVVE